MSTPLQDIYDCFTNKCDEDFSFKDRQIFGYFTSALSRVYKYINHKVDYILSKSKKIQIYTLPNNNNNSFNFIIDGNSLNINISITDTPLMILNNIKEKIESISPNIYNLLLDGEEQQLIISNIKGVDINLTYLDINNTGLELYIEDTFDGNMIDDMDIDEVELISLWMSYAHTGKKRKHLESLERDIGTKDFDRLPDKRRELDGLKSSMDDTKSDIKDLEQRFNDYSY